MNSVGASEVRSVEAACNLRRDLLPPSSTSVKLMMFVNHRENDGHEEEQIIGFLKLPQFSIPTRICALTAVSARRLHSASAAPSTNTLSSPRANRCHCSSWVSGAVTITATLSLGWVSLEKSTAKSSSARCAAVKGWRRSV